MSPSGKSKLQGFFLPGFALNLRFLFFPPEGEGAERHGPMALESINVWFLCSWNLTNSLHWYANQSHYSNLEDALQQHQDWLGEARFFVKFANFCTSALNSAHCMGRSAQLMHCPCPTSAAVNSIRDRRYQIHAIWLITNSRFWTVVSVRYDFSKFP